MAELFDDHRHHLGVRIIDQPADVVLNPARRLISGRHGVGYRDVAREQHGGEHRRHRARLRNHPDRWAAGLAAQGFDEGQRDPVDVVDAAKAVRAFDDHASFGGNAADFLLLSQAFFAAFGKPGGIDHRRANLAFRQPAHRIQHKGAWDCQHSAIHTFGQLRHRFQAIASAQSLAIGVYRIDGPGKPVLVEVRQQRGAKRPRLVRRADDGNGGWPDQPVDLGWRQSGRQHWGCPVINVGGTRRSAISAQPSTHRKCRGPA